MTITANAQVTSPQETRVQAAGPLVVSKTNARYFTVRSTDGSEGRAVYLTGSHIWNNLHDGMGPGPECAATPERFDYAAYLRFLKERGHNFIRLWRWEHFKSQAPGGYHFCMLPQPWLRTGPGNAKDGKPKFDLSKHDPAFFERLRERVAAAGREGIYVGVLLFDGWGLHLSPAPDQVEGHPFHSAANINGVGIRSIVDHQVLPLAPRVQAIQEAYIRKVVDVLHDLPNVLYEVSNESSGGGKADENFAKFLGLQSVPEWGNSTEWQYWVIDLVKRHEKEKGYTSHPIGMTMQFPVAKQTKVNDPLYASRAEWISPGFDDEIFANGDFPMRPGAPQSHWYIDPRPADGRKVIITDTDHYAPGKGDVMWAWKSFLRGHHPILMDFGLLGGVTPADPTKAAPSDASGGGPPVPTFASMEATRFAMGDTRRYAERMQLIAMTPRPEVTSTGYALANPGREYLVLQPSEKGDRFTVTLTPGTYAVEWFNVDTRAVTQAQQVEVKAAIALEFTPPFSAGPSVLYLKRAGR